MKKRFLAILPALALCLGLATPAFAVDAGSLTDINSITEEDIKSTFTILRNGTVNELDGRYRASEPALVDDMGNGEPGEINYHVFGQGDSWTITNTGSKAIQFTESSDYTLSFTTWQYGLVPGEGYIWVGGMSEIDAQGHQVHAPDENTQLASLKAGESITIPASTFAGEGPYEGESITVLSINIYYEGADSELSPNGILLDYLFYFMGDDAMKAKLEQAQGDNKPVFTDVPQWCAPAVDWAVEQGITKGYGNNDFRPDVPCTHAQILTFLWRAAGCPDPEDKAPVVVESYYQDGVDWAYGEGLVDDTSFVPGAPCTRGSAMLYIWNAFGQMGADGHGFNDIPPEDEALNLAVNFAAAGGIANGFSNIDGTYSFRPNSICSRGHIVTFLYRAYVPEARLP